MTENFQFEMQYPSGFLQRALQRSIDLVALGLHAAEHAGPENLDIPGSFGQISPARDRQLSVEEAKIEFRSWVLANGLRDCVEALGTTLEWARKHCILWSQPGKVERNAEGTLRLSAQFTGHVWNSEIIGATDKFDRLPLPKKFQHLEDKFHIARPELADDILALNAARNCLAHRMGVVGRQDLAEPSDNALVITWRKLEMQAQGPSGTRIVAEGSRVEEGESITIGFATMKRIFKLGEKITLSESDYVDVAGTFMLFGQQLQSSIGQMQQRRYDTQGTS